MTLSASQPNIDWSARAFDDDDLVISQRFRSGSLECGDILAHPKYKKEGILGAVVLPHSLIHFGMGWFRSIPVGYLGQPPSAETGSELETEMDADLDTDSLSPNMVDDFSLKLLSSIFVASEEVPKYTASGGLSELFKSNMFKDAASISSISTKFSMALQDAHLDNTLNTSVDFDAKCSSLSPLSHISQLASPQRDASPHSSPKHEEESSAVVQEERPPALSPKPVEELSVASPSERSPKSPHKPVVTQKRDASPEQKRSSPQPFEVSPRKLPRLSPEATTPKDLQEVTADKSDSPTNSTDIVDDSNLKDVDSIEKVTAPIGTESSMEVDESKPSKVSPDTSERNGPVSELPDAPLSAKSEEAHASSAEKPALPEAPLSPKSENPSPSAEPASLLKPNAEKSSLTNEPSNFKAESPLSSDKPTSPQIPETEKLSSPKLSPNPADTNAEKASLSNGPTSPVKATVETSPLTNEPVGPNNPVTEKTALNGSTSPDNQDKKISTPSKKPTSPSNLGAGKSTLDSKPSSSKQPEPEDSTLSKKVSSPNGSAAENPSHSNGSKSPRSPEIKEVSPKPASDRSNPSPIPESPSPATKTNDTKTKHSSDSVNDLPLSHNSDDFREHWQNIETEGYPAQTLPPLNEELQDGYWNKFYTPTETFPMKMFSKYAIHFFTSARTDAGPLPAEIDLDGPPGQVADNMVALVRKIYDQAGSGMSHDLKATVNQALCVIGKHLQDKSSVVIDDFITRNYQPVNKKVSSADRIAAVARFVARVWDSRAPISRMSNLHVNFYKLAGLLGEQGTNSIVSALHHLQDKYPPTDD